MFVEERTKYAGQPVGLVVAKDRDTALRAARMVIVGYEDIRKPILTIKEALAEGGRDELAISFLTGKSEASVLGDPEGVSYRRGKVLFLLLTSLPQLVLRGLSWEGNHASRFG